MGSPGPICGWTFSNAFGGGSGTITFAPGTMTLHTTNATDFPGATKDLPSPLASVFGIAALFDFTEYPTPPDAMTTYDFVINNVDLSETVFLGIFGDGSLILQVGDPAAAATYSGVWTPSNGAHRVYFAIDAQGNPTLFMDGVAVALTSLGVSGTFAAFLPQNSIAVVGGSASVTPADSEVRGMFVTTGDPGPQSLFCCPS